MKKKILAFGITVLFALMFPACVSMTDARDSEPKPFNDISALELVSRIRIGWNLGNTLDTSDLHWLDRNASVSQFETAWGNPVTTKTHITSVKNAGFNTIRIPVSWAKCADRNYNIRKDWMRRVKQVVDFAVENDMIIILNTHHDESIFKFYDKDREESKKALTRIWEQIAEVFKGYDEKLIFEGMNEPRTKGSAAEWNGGTAEERENVNILNQVFVDTVRASGGNNEKRILMIPTYAASATHQAMSALKIPADSAKNKIIVSIHAYEPYNFALNEKSPVNTWNAANEGDTLPVTERLDRAYDLFISKGTPVLMGEFAALNKNNEDARAEWAQFYVSYAKSKGVKCVWWDDGGENNPPAGMGLFARRANHFAYPKILDALMKASEP